jgi:hypothetical protein
MASIFVDISAWCAFLSLPHIAVATANKVLDCRVMKLWELLCSTRRITHQAGGQKVQQRWCRS